MVGDSRAGVWPAPSAKGDRKVDQLIERFYYICKR